MSAPLSAIITGPNQTAAVSSLLVNNEPVFNVKDFKYGAKGDGITDDSTAIQNAFNDAMISGGTVYFPNGNYKVNSGLTITAPIGIKSAPSVKGSITYGAKIFAGTAMTDMINVNPGSNAVELFHNIILDGNGLATNVLTITGANTTKISSWGLEVVGGAHVGINITSNHSIFFYHLKCFSNGSGSVNDCGVKVGGAVPPNVVQFLFPNIEANNGCGVILSSGDKTSFIGGVIEGNAFHGIWGNGNPQHVLVDGTWFEANDSSATANIYDIFIASTSCLGWVIRNANLYPTNETFTVWNGGTNTIIEQSDQIGKIHWDTTASGGYYIGPSGALDATSTYNPSFIPTPPSPQPPRVNPVLYYDMSTLTADGKMQDLSNSGRDGTITGTTPQPNGKYGGATTFAVTDQIVAPAPPNNLNMTICAWFKYTTLPTPTYAGIAGLGPTAGVSYELRVLINGHIACIWYQQAGPDIASSVTSISGTLNDGTWHHAAGVLTNGQATLYIDGVLQGTSATTLTSVLSSGPNMRIGIDASGYVGDMDEVLIFEQALTSAQINSIYQNSFIPSAIQSPERSRLSQGTTGARGLIELYDATTGALRFAYIDNGAWVISSTRPT